MFKRLFSPLTLINQLTLIVLLSAAIGITGMAVAGWLGQGIQGSAHAINKAGSMRMQSYRLLSAVPLQASDTRLIADMERTTFSQELAQAAQRDGETARLEALQRYWRETLEPALRQARHPDAVRMNVEDFVHQIDVLVTAFDHTTELRIERIVMLQHALAGLMCLLLVFTVIWLRQRLLRPWRQLMAMATAVGHRDFSQRVTISGRDEMATLGQSLNSMSSELAASYSVLEERVAEKTAVLAHKNEMLAFLWQASRRLHSSAPLCERLAPVLNELQQLTLLREIELRVYEFDDEENTQEFTWQANAACDEKGCHLCPRQPTPPDASSTTLKWRLTDTHNQYGLMLAKLPKGCHLSQDQQQMVDTLVEQITASLAIDRQQDHQQQLVVMEERAAIARELHDSIAQSLSCLKMQVSCLQMQGETLPESVRTLLSQMRNELNSSWVQLRELLTTFRLQLTEPGLRPALEASCQEFSSRLGFPVELNYQLPPRLIPPHQAIHVLHIAREALNNALKHAGASAIRVSVAWHNRQVTLSVQDNGRGVAENAERSNHYGLIIMRDRAQSLRGDCQVRRREAGGTEVIVTFIPDTPSPSLQGDTYE